MCLDHPTVQELVGQIEDRRIITYGENPQADVRLVDVDLSGGMSRFSVVIRDRKTGRQTTDRKDLGCRCPAITMRSMPSAAIAVANQLGMSADQIRGALASFGGVKRRFTPHRRMERRASSSTITATIRSRSPPCCAPPAPRPKAMSSPSCSRIAIRGFRLLFNEFAGCFNDADTVIVADVYAAGEAPIAGADRDDLVAAIKARGHRQALALQSPAELAGIIRELARPGDYVVLLGAGNITQWAYALPGELAAAAA